MITTNDIQRLTQQKTEGRDILSLYLDMSVNSDNKRTHNVFLAKEKGRFAELQSDRDSHHREPVGELFERVEQWLADEYEPTNKAVVIFAEVGGSWFDAFQLPAPVRNRLVIQDSPVIGPLAALVHSHPRCGVILVDREHLRLIPLHMGQAGEEVRVEPNAIDAAHDVQAGGYAHKDYQKKKAEETRHFFKDFVEEITKFDQRLAPVHYVLLGTTETTQNFREFLPKGITDRIIHTAHSPMYATGPEIARELQPVFAEHARMQEAAALNEVQDRVRQSHFATSGMHDTLVQLQEGKVERLVVSRDLEPKDGVQCTKCGFLLVRRDGECPYCGGALRDGVDLVESMMRMAATQDIGVEFVAGDTMRDLKGVAALLKF